MIHLLVAMEDVKATEYRTMINCRLTLIQLVSHVSRIDLRSKVALGHLIFENMCFSFLIYG